jgi:hypothetical protein
MGVNEADLLDYDDHLAIRQSENVGVSPRTLSTAFLREQVGPLSGPAGAQPRQAASSAPFGSGRC